MGPSPTHAQSSPAGEPLEHRFGRPKSDEPMLSGGASRKMNRRTAMAALALTLYVVMPTTAEQTCSFPAAVKVCRSPNDLWLLRWQEATESAPHVLFADQRQTGRSVKLLTFGRNVDAMWSPDVTHIAITDHAGSNYSSVFIAELASGRLTDVEQEMHRTLKTQPLIYANGHRYFSALRWQSATRLVFEVRAYDAEPGREVRATFTFDLKNRIVAPAS
jgi:hypothetical protein